MRFFVKILLITGLFLLSTKGFSQKQKTKPLSEAQKKLVITNFYDATKALLLDDKQVAMNLYEECLHLDPLNDAVLYNLSIIKFDIGKYSEAFTLINRAIEIAPDNKWYIEKKAQFLVQQREYKSAAKIYESLALGNPTKIEYFEDWARCFLYINDFKSALEVYDAIESNYGFNEDFCLSKIEILDHIKAYDNALVEIKRLLERYPNNVDFLNMIANTYSKKGDKNNTLLYLNKIISLDSTNSTAYLSLHDFYKEQKDSIQSFYYLNKAFRCQDMNIDSKMQILLAYYSASEIMPYKKEEAYTLINTLVRQHPTEPKVYSIQGDYLLRDKKQKEARQSFLKVIELGSNKYEVWQQILFLDSDLAENDSLKKHSQQAMDLFPTQPLVYLLNGVACINLKEYTQAQKALETGKNLVILNDKLLNEFYTYLAECYFNMKEISKSYAYFEKALVKDVNNTLVLNNYSYYLSLHKDSLDKAEKMALQANLLEPNQASYQDTYAWILYQRGKYTEAKEWIEKAIANGGDKNDIILEHYGDILFKLNQKEEAIRQWNKAKTFGNGSEFLNQKIEQNTLIE